MPTRLELAWEVADQFQSKEYTGERFDFQHIDGDRVVFDFTARVRLGVEQLQQQASARDLDLEPDWLEAQARGQFSKEIQSQIENIDAELHVDEAEMKSPLSLIGYGSDGQADYEYTARISAVAVPLEELEATESSDET